MQNKQPLISLKIINNKSKKVLHISSYKSKRIYHFLEAGKFPDFAFQVSVRYLDGSKNESPYTTKGEVRKALKAFLE